QEAHAEDLLSEVPLVELALEDALVHSLKLRQRELRGEQLEPDRLMTHFGPQALERTRNDRVVVERERRQIEGREPGRFARVRRCLDAVVGELDEREVGYGDDSLARIAIDGAERVELLEEDPRDARLLGELAPRRFVERLVDADEPAGERPLPLEG